MITMLGSTVLGGVMSIWSQSIKAKQAEQKMLIQRAEVQQQGFKQAREYEACWFSMDPNYSFSSCLCDSLVAKILPIMISDTSARCSWLHNLNLHFSF